MWEWAQVAVLVANLAWTTACLGGSRPETMVVTLSLTTLLVALHLVACADRCDARMHPAGWLLLPFLAYAAANVIWISPVRWIGWRDWLGWAQMIAVFWVVLNGVRSRTTLAALFWSLVVIGLGAVVLACYQRFVRPDWLMLGRTQADQFLGRASGPFGIPNSLAALLLLLLFPMGQLLCRRGTSAVWRVWCGYVGAALAFGLFLTVSRGAWLALALVAIGWPLIASRRAWWQRMLAGGAIAASVALVVVVLFATVPLVRERLVSLKTDAGERTRPIMWRGAWQLFQTAPVVGTGAESYNVLFERYRPERYQDEPVWAHNDYLNTLSDYGLVGFGLFFGAVGAIVWRCSRSDTSAASPRARHDGKASETGELPIAGMTAGLAAFGLQLFVDFHFKIPALAMSCAAVGAVVVHAKWPRPGLAKPNRLAARVAFGAVAIAVSGAWIARGLPLYRAEAARYSARQSIDRLAVRQLGVNEWAPVLTQVSESLAQAVVWDPQNGAAWADLSYVTALRAHLEPTRMKELGELAERHADRALGCARVVPEFWIRKGIALDLQGRRIEAGAPFIEALKLAPANAGIWFYQAFHLSLDQSEPGRALAAVAFCLRLDPGNTQAQALRARLADRSRARDSSTHAPE